MAASVVLPRIIVRKLYLAECQYTLTGLQCHFMTCYNPSRLMQLLETPSELKVQFEGKTYEIKYDNLNNASVRIKHAASMGTMIVDPSINGILSSEPLCSCETSFSAIFTMTLDKLCFGQNFDASIIHQGPVRKKAKTQGNPDTADMLAVRIINT